MSTQQAAERSAITANSVDELLLTTDSIGNIVTLIDNISKTTTMLGLNAALEATRAGESGKGFAQVAEEVRSLSRQTADATAKVAQQIAAMQSAISGSVVNIGVVDRAVKEVSDTTATISSCMQEQSSATHEIWRNVDSATGLAAGIAQGVKSVAASARSLGAAATQVKSSSNEVATLSHSVRSDVDQFLLELKAA